MKIKDLTIPRDQIGRARVPKSWAPFLRSFLSSQNPLNCHMMSKNKVFHANPVFSRFTNKCLVFVRLLAMPACDVILGGGVAHLILLLCSGVQVGRTQKPRTACEHIAHTCSLSSVIFSSWGLCAYLAFVFSRVSRIDLFENLVKHIVI